MQSATTRPSNRWSLTVATLVLALSATVTRGDIYRWEWVNPDDPGQGRQASTLVCPGGLGVTPAPEINLSGRDLTRAYLAGANLERAEFFGAQIMGADLSGARLASAHLAGVTANSAWFRGADLTGAALSYSTLVDADLTDAIITEAAFTNTQLTSMQLYSTASYKARDLHWVEFSFNDFSGWNLAGVNLSGSGWTRTKLQNANLAGAVLDRAWFNETDASGADLRGVYFRNANIGASILHRANLAGADLSNSEVKSSFDSAILAGVNFTGALIEDADFANTTAFGLTAEQIYSTRSYQQLGLNDIDFSRNDLSGWNFARRGLGRSKFIGTTLSGADFTGAFIAQANFGDGRNHAGLTAQQLYTTASYAKRDLHGLELWNNDLSGWNFAGQNLTWGNFSWATLTEASFAGADLTGMDLHNAILTNADFTRARLAKTVFTNADLERADLRGAVGLSEWVLLGTRNTIGPAGAIASLFLNSGETFIVRDSGAMPLHVANAAWFHDDATLRLVIDKPAWLSTIGFDQDTPVLLGGTLQLTLAEGIDPATLLGHDLRLFDWTGVEPNGQFRIASSLQWDTSRLYSEGIVRLVPEPTLAFTLLPAAFLLLRRQLPAGVPTHRRYR